MFNSLKSVNPDGSSDCSSAIFSVPDFFCETSGATSAFFEGVALGFQFSGNDLVKLAVFDFGSRHFEAFAFSNAMNAFIATP